MKTLFNFFLIVHILCIAVIVILLLLQTNKATKRIPKGLVHAGDTALIAGLIMIVIRSIQHHDHPTQYDNYNFGTLAAKFIILIVILSIAYRKAKAESISKATWMTLLGLTVINIGLAQSL